MTSGIRLETNSPRPNWQQSVEATGLIWHGVGKDHYWSESQHLSFDLASIETLEEAATELQRMFMRAAGEIIRQDWWSRLEIPEFAVEAIKASWLRGDFSLYGRFDLAWNGTGHPKLLEYNADTPTSLLEASITQWEWLQEVFPDHDQLNSLHEALVERWQKLNAQSVHFACVWDAIEDRQTVAYLAETAEQAGKQVKLMDVGELGYNEQGQFIDGDEEPIEKLFKLYPWEWAAREEFGEELVNQASMLCEPIWKMLWSNKGILPILWELYPDHPLLLPSFEQISGLQSLGVSSYVEKPIFGREGGGITLYEGNQVLAQQAQMEEPGKRIYQQKAELFQAGDDYFVFGMWMIGDQCCGMTTRADRSPITGNLSRFVPHRIR